MKYGLLLLFALTLISCSKEQPALVFELQEEQYRPQIHFTPEANWMNDPNGMVYYEDEYHLFYQYHPDSTVWGPMHWGHAVSKDMVTWERLPIALYPDSLGDIFSGSAVIDWKNTTGFQNGEHPPMVAIFTQHLMEGERSGRIDFQTQGIAYSLDKGRTWTVYDGNPVIPNPGIKDFRDPKVIWHEESEKWVMVFAAGDCIKFYTSPNLIDWQFESDYGMEEGAHGGVWECPDIFKLRIEGEDREKWVLLVSINPGAPNGGSGTQYFVGDFDGKTFTNSQYPERTSWLDYGRDNYAGVTWSDIPEEDGRRLFIGWMSNWDYAQVVPTEEWRSAMTLPRSLHLKRNDQTGVYSVESRPVKELESLESDKIEMKYNAKVGKNNVYRFDQRNDKQFQLPYKLEVTFDLSESSSKYFGVRLDNPETGDVYELGFKDGRLFSDRTKSGNTDFEERFAKEIHYTQTRNISDDQKVELEVFFDHSSVEIFVNNGEFSMTELYFPKQGYMRGLIFSKEGEVTFNGLTTTSLKSIW